MPSAESSYIEQPGPRPNRLRRIIQKLSRTATVAEVTAPVLQEAQQESTDPAPLIRETATKVGINLTPKRLAYLAEIVTTDPRVARGSFAAPDNSWISISLPFAEEGNGKTSSEIHFLPDTKKMKWANVPQRQEMTSVMNGGLEGLQNYVLLAEAGLLSPADELKSYKETNPVMARVSERLGFSGTNGEITVPFQTLRERVLSPEMIAFQGKLEHRLATMTQPVPQQTSASQMQG